MTNNKIFLSMAALAFVGAMTAGCSSDNLNAETPQLPDTNNGTVTMKVTVSLDEHASTRALTEAGVKTFEAGDKIAVIYKNTAGETVKAESAALQSIDLHDAQKTASFSVTLTNPKASTPVRYIYPAVMAKDVANDATITSDDATIDYTGLLNSQNGDLTTLGTNYDLAVYDGSLNGTDLPSSSTLTNPLAICGFTLTDGGSDITNTVNSLTVSDGTNSYAITPSALSTIYVAMKPTSGNIAFAASTTATKTYFKTATGKTLDASKLYPISVSMVELALGNVFCSDGSIYESKGAAEGASKTPVALICYLGNDAETNTTYRHGLALAFTNIGFNYWCSQNSANCLTTQYDNEAAAITDMAGIANTDALVSHTGHSHYAANAARNYAVVHPTGTSVWFLPSAGQWNKMINASKSILIANAGIKRNDLLWSSTELDTAGAWFKYFDRGWIQGDKQANPNVRACLAF